MAFVSSNNLLPFCFLALVFASSAIQLSLSLPFVLLHGINNSCSGVKTFTETLSNYSGEQGYCLEVGNGACDSVFMPIEKQAGIICEKVKKMEELKEGYNLVGISQGNMVGRGVIEFCDGGPPVKNYISLGGPHAGVASVPCNHSESLCVFVNFVVREEVYTDLVQDNIAPSNYFKLPMQIPKYLEKCKFLPKLNNELPGAKNSTYKTRFSSLQNLVLIMFANDTVLVPKETSLFGYYPDGNSDIILPFEQTKLYIEDWIGLKTLNDARRVKNITVSGDHIELSKDDMIKYVIPYLKG